ncbi:MAG TPA: hypothetical protein VIM07_14780 [Chitinophagaceae bacterium]
MTKLFFFLIATCLAMSCLAQTVTFSGENYIEISSPKIKKQRIDFNRVYTTDWFVTANDSHCAINFEGPYDSRKLTLAIEWSGKKDEYVITNETSHAGDRSTDFRLTSPDKDTYGDGLGAQPEGDQQVIVKVEKITDDNISGNISGLISDGKDVIKINGHFSLAKKAAKPTAKSTSLTFKDCDNVIHDKLTGAQDRSPTDCEVKYDLEVKSAFQKAFENVVSGFQNNHWLVTKITTLDPVTGVPRAFDNSSFLGDYNIELEVGPENDQYASYNKSYQELLNGGSQDIKKIQDFMKQMNGAIRIKIYARVNSTYSSITIFKDGHKMLKALGAAYVIESSYVQSAGGGGIDASLDATFIFIGNWNPPVIRKDSDGGEEIKVPPVIVKSGTNLSVKNISIRMECNSELAEKILKEIDFTKLTSLLN